MRFYSYQLRQLLNLYYSHWLRLRRRWRQLEALPLENDLGRKPAGAQSVPKKISATQCRVTAIE